jgi:membrane protein YqaA with SNARE-associated domain
MQIENASPPAVTKERNPIRRLYHWVLHWASTPYGVPALFVLAFVESSFFPIPPDVLLIALCLALPTRSFRFAAWCTAGSALGGAFGYFLGWALWQNVESLVIPRIFSQEIFDKVTGIYHEWDFAAVFVAAFTPIPYKVFTIAAGVAKLNLPGFLAASVIGRGARFFLVAFLLYRFGERARPLIEKHFEKLTLLGTLVLVGGFLLLKVF